MCLHKMEQRVIGSSGQLFDEQALVEFCAVQKQQQQQQEEVCSRPEKVQPEMVQSKVAEEVLYRDVLVGATQATREFFDFCKVLARHFQRSTAYK